jgi:Flp pilus assembly protein TadB
MGPDRQTSGKNRDQLGQTSTMKTAIGVLAGLIREVMVGALSIAGAVLVVLVVIVVALLMAWRWWRRTG